MLLNARTAAARRNNKLMAAAASLLTALSLVAGAITAQASPPTTAPSTAQQSVQTKDPVAPPQPEAPAQEAPKLKAELAPDRDPHASPDRAIKGSPIQQSATAEAAPRMDVWFETREYYGQDMIFCDFADVSFIQGKQYVLCAVMFPKDSAGNPTEFSPNNTIHFTVQDGCGATASDRTYYNIYTSGTSPNVLREYTPIPSGVVSVPWGALAP